MENNIWRYSTIAIILHWFVAFLVLSLISCGWYMLSIQDQPNSGWYFNLHKSFGLVAATLIFYRLIWRLSHTPAPLPTSVAHWQAVLSRVIHWLLYLCMILMPVSGFIGASYGSHGVSFFGLKIPVWVDPNHIISTQLFNIHGIFAWILVGLISLHVLAAMKHLFINKDKVFQRMM